MKVGVKTPEAALAEAVRVWKRAEKGRAPRKAIEGVYFADFVTMARVLTPRRIGLLLTLQARGKLTVRALAQRLKRDYKNVHGDVQRLKQTGLIETENGYVHVPWKDRVDRQTSAPRGVRNSSMCDMRHYHELDILQCQSHWRKTCRPQANRETAGPTADFCASTAAATNPTSRTPHRSGGASCS